MEGKREMQELDDVLLKRGDVIDYCIVNDNYNSSMIIHDETTISHFQEILECKITKVQRPTKFETIYNVSKPILDKEEKEYLENVIRPFRDRVKTIMKVSSFKYNEEFIYIFLNTEFIHMPRFSKGTMYKGMILNKEYTLEELGLFEE